MFASVPASEEPLPPTQPTGDDGNTCGDCAQLRTEVASLQAQLFHEQDMRRRAELRVAAEGQRADAALEKYHEYKQRLLGAKESYGELKENYIRLQGVLNDLLSGGHGSATEASAEGAATRENAPNSTPVAAPAPSTVKFEPVEKKKEEKAVPVAPAKKTAPPPAAAPPPPNAAAVAAAIAAPGVPKPKWKKAVRNNKGGDEFSVGQRRRRVSRQQAEEEDAAAEAAFNAPPAKRYVPPGGYRATPAAPAAPPQQAPAPAAPQQQPAGQGPHFDPRVNGGMPYKHREVVRKKDERAALQGYECQDCRRFYEAVEKWGAVWEGGMPACTHRPGEAAAATAALREQLRAGASRHRYLYEPPPTPEGFWDLGLTPTK